MKYRVPIFSLPKLWPLAAALLLVVLSRAHAEDVDTIIIQAAPAQVITPYVVPVQVEEVKAANQVAGQKKAARPTAAICYPTIYPNPLAFNMTWVTITNETVVRARLLAARQMALARRAAVVRRPPLNAAAQNAIQQQVRKILEPMLTTELSFAARVTDLNREERRKLRADGKTWFEKFLADFLKRQDPNQQQMFLQGMQGVWFGNQQQKTESPRDAIRTGVAKLVKDTLPKEKVAAYADECQKRDDFACQVAIDNLVERIDEKVKLSPDQLKKASNTLREHWDKSHVPQLEAFALNQSTWPGGPTDWVIPQLSLAQRAVLNRINATSGRMFINGGIFGQMFSGDVAVFDDMEVDANVEVAEPAAEEVKPEAE